jgi:hypothetical protein
MPTSNNDLKGLAHASADAELTQSKGRVRAVVEEGHEAIPVPVAVPASGLHAEVEVSVGATIGLPGYSAARFDVRLRLPCKASLAGIEGAYASALAFCESKLAELKATVE